jgi:hypothetical protein
MQVAEWCITSSKTKTNKAVLFQIAGNSTKQERSHSLIKTTIWKHPAST